MKPIMRTLGYAAIAIIAFATYLTTRDFMADTPAGVVIVSNLTVNYMLMACLTGGFSGWYSYNWLLRKQPIFLRLVGTSLLVCVVAILWLSVMSLGGYQVRWLR